MKKIGVDRRIIYIIFFACLCLLLVQHRYVELYFDDYGNASLSYGYTAPDVCGTNWKIGDIIEWAKWCYSNWGGRILYAAVVLFPLIKHSALPFMLIQAFVITGILFLLYKLVVHEMKIKTENACLSVLLIASFMLIGQDVHRYGTYWASASVLYIWPLLPFLLSIYLYEVTEEKYVISKKTHVKMNALQVILVFFSTFSQEQVGLSVIAFYFIFIGIKHWKKWKLYYKIDAPILITTCISYLSLFMAPGNFNRLGTTAFSKMSFTEKVVYNFPIIIRYFFADGLKWLNVLMTLMVLLGALRLVKVKTIAWIAVGASGISFALCCAAIEKPIFWGTYGVVLGCFVMLTIVVVTSFYCCVYGRFGILALMYAGGISVGCLVMSPAIDLRSYLEYIFMIMIVTGMYFQDMYSLLKGQRKIWGMYILLICVLVIGGTNYTKILSGYRENYSSLHYNEKVLKAYTGSEKIYLKKTPNLDYRGPMPYEENYEGTEYWMKEYYNIPLETEFIWEDINN